MLDVVYLYHDKPAKWQELRYSLRSLEKFMQCEYRVILVCDKLPDWIQYVAWLPCAHSGGSRYRDVTRKIELVANSTLVKQRLLFMYDDIYLLDKVQHPEGFHASVFKTDLKVSKASGNNKWLDTLLRTQEWLRKHNLPEQNLETHLPRFVNKDALLAFFKAVPVVVQNMQRWTAFGNWLSVGQHQRDAREVKAGFYGYASEYSHPSLTLEQVEQAVKGKLVLNHNDDGLTPSLKEFLQKQFPQPSRYERR